MKAVIDSAEIQRRGAQHALAARLDLARSARSLLAEFACSQAADSVIEEATASIQHACDLLAQHPKRAGHIRSVEGALTGLGELSELGPFTGRLHPIAPPFRLVLNGDRAEAYATYGSQHQGAPGLVQGGFIAATFDELLGVVQAGTLRLTVDLQVSYRAPAPLHSELRYTTWLERIDGRKAHVSGTLHEGDRLCAEARGLFVEPRQIPV